MADGSRPIQDLVNVSGGKGSCNTLETVRKIAARTADITPLARGDLL